MVTVMGPTPPGTGVMAAALPLQLSASTSPTSRLPLFVVASSMEWMPTSITTAPSLIMSPVTYFGLPMAATRMSALRVWAGMSVVWEWHTVTVAFSFIRQRAMGRPTILDRPSTTAFLPFISTPDRLSSSMQPKGVQGTNSGSRPFCARLPVLRGWKPSTSFSNDTASRTVFSCTCDGSGNCTRKPWMAGSLFSFSTSASTSSVVTVSGSSTSRKAMPTPSAARFFMRTYVDESARLPTSTTPTPGVMPLAFSSVT
mmetsp:Transcript_20702/g.52420  ORF Transcript_20702/g.52420 Transcript_20702/m.52420 type:complete len:256 (+) Transcript_20702:122-889(+)